MENNKDYSKLIKVLQIAAGILMLAGVVVFIIFKKKYNISLSNIEGLSEMLKGGTLTLSLIFIGFSVVKSFALVFPPAVLISIAGYMIPNFGIALIVNLFGTVLSLTIPWALGKFTGEAMVTTLSKRFKAIKKIEDFTGTNEKVMTFAIKLAGVLPGDLSSLIFGAMGISYKNYMIGSSLGMLPLVIIYTWFGYALKSVGDKPWLTAIPVVVIVVFVIVASFITKKLVSKNKENNATNEN